jgi:hypothetical protein
MPETQPPINMPGHPSSPGAKPAGTLPDVLHGGKDVAKVPVLPPTLETLQTQITALQTEVAALKTHVHMVYGPMPVSNAYMTLSGLQSSPAAEGSDYYLLVLRDPVQFQEELKSWEANPPQGPTGPPVPPPPPPGGPNEGGEQ